MLKTQHYRLLTRLAFFSLYLLAPVFDLLRYDLNTQTLFFFGQQIDIGLKSFFEDQISSLDMLINFASMIFIPVIILILIGALVTWKWGLLYCGWLCPHESVVEIINKLMRQSSGKLTLWDTKKLPEHQLDGTRITPNKYKWLVTGFVIIALAFVWAISILTYILPPVQIYQNLFNLNFTFYQSLYLLIATTLFALEFAFARHLFCRFGCSVGFFQSLIWMQNKKAMVVGFDKSRAKQCTDCDASCEIACPIKLNPRTVKKHMYSCSQCMRCIDACTSVQQYKAYKKPLLQMLNNNCSLDKSTYEFGKNKVTANKCYSAK